MLALVLQIRGTSPGAGTVEGKVRDAGKRDERVTITAFCSTCQTTLYVEKEEAQICPVCSTPLVEIKPAVSDPAPITP